MFCSTKSVLLIAIVLVVSKDVKSDKSSVVQHDISALQSESSTDGLKDSFNHTRKYLLTTSILYRLTEVAASEKISTENELCYKQLQQIQEGVLQKQPWAMKVLDASATKPPGFIFQQNFWLGSRPSCATVNEPLRIALYGGIKRSMKAGLIANVAPFEVGFRVAYLNHSSPWQLQLTIKTLPILHLGLCLPASCATNHVHHLLEEMIRRKMFFESDLYEFQTEVLYVKDLQLKDDFFQRRSLKIAISMLIFTGIMMLASAYFRMKYTFAEKECSRGEEDSSDVALDNTGSKANEAQNPMMCFVNCFDVRQNCRKLFNSKPYRSQDIPAINGLRCLQAWAVLIAHMVWFGRHTTHNKAFVQNYLETRIYQIHNGGIYLVDAFFTISGFLLTLFFLRNAKLRETICENSLMRNLRLFVGFLFHRLLRLAPLYLFTMATVDFCSAYINDISLFHYYERYDKFCSQYWWRNVLFIQNYFPYDELCMNWSWSICCEMQYFVLANVLLFVSVKHPKLVRGCVFTFLVSCIAWTLYKGTSSRFQLAMEGLTSTVDDIYINPIVRFLPYLVGSIAASWYFANQKRLSEMSTVSVKCCWSMAGILILGTSYTMHWRDLDYLTSIALYILGLAMMSLGVSWIIIGSALGRSCWWSRPFEARIFQHLGRLTYAIYMTNPLIAMLLSNFREHEVPVDAVLMLMYAIAFTIIMYVVSMGFSLAFEIPYCNWSRILRERVKQKTS